MSNVCLEDASTSKRSRHSKTTVFDFKEHCIFCGEKWIMDFDNKNPHRWRRVLLWKLSDQHDLQSYKQTILDVIDSRQEEEGRQVKIRLMDAIGDLHTADARYHDDCRKSFMEPRSVAAAAHSGRETQDIEPAVSSTILSMKNDMLHIWNSIGVYNMYKDHGGKLYSRRTLLSKLLDILGSELLVLSGEGVGSLILFRSRASTAINLVASDDQMKMMPLMFP